MIDYGQSPTNQTELPIVSAYDEMQEVRQWVDAHPVAWRQYMAIARTESAFGSLSPSYVVEILRHRHKVSVRTAWKPALARLAMEQDGSIDFRLARSKFDPFVGAVL